MNLQEFSIEFDIALNNIMSNQAPGHSEYEKSVFLTQAEEAIVLGICNGSVGNSFEETEEVTHYLAPLVSQAVVTETADLDHIVEGSYIFKCPYDMLFRTYESCILKDDTAFSCDGGTREASVVPTTQDEFWRTNRNPFKGTNERRVLRLAYDRFDNVDGAKTTAKYSELISRYKVDSYKVRYIRRPKPIILEDLPNGLTIDGIGTATPCELNPAIHKRIVLEAVNIAKLAWQ